MLGAFHSEVLLLPSKDFCLNCNASKNKELIDNMNEIRLVWKHPEQMSHQLQAGHIMRFLKNLLDKTTSSEVNALLRLGMGKLDVKGVTDWEKKLTIIGGTHNAFLLGLTVILPALMYPIMKIVVKPCDSTHNREVKIGETIQLKTAINKPPGIEPEVTWISMCPSIATIDKNGLVKGEVIGKAVIIAQVKIGNDKITSPQFELSVV